MGTIPRIWRSFGYDELNWTYTSRGKRLFKEIDALADAPYWIRCHHTFTSGNGLSVPTRGSGNVCRRSSTGALEFDFTILDRVFDTFVANGCKPIVELGFMPDALSSGPEPKPAYDYSGSDLWMYPPRDCREWQALVFQTVHHCVQRYGEKEVASWYWELWNEPDNPGFFKGSVKDYCRMYDHAVAGAVAAFDAVRIGGPGLARNPKFLHKFLTHCAAGRNRADGRRGARLDFISFHAKGTGWPLKGQPFDMPRLETIRGQMHSYDRVLKQFPQFRERPILFDECDMAVATNYGVYDFPEFSINNTEYFPVFVIRMAKTILDEMETRKLPIEFFTTWAFYFEGKRFFEGNRALFTNEDIKKPVFNAFSMLEKLGTTRLQLETQGEADFPRIDALASRHEEGSIAVIVWNFDEDVSQGGNDKVSLEFRNLSQTTGELKLDIFQIDNRQSNAHTAWQELGAPQDPDPDQLQKIKARQNLAQLVSQEKIPFKDSQLVHMVDLPMPGACLIRLQPVD